MSIPLIIRKIFLKLPRISMYTGLIAIFLMVMVLVLLAVWTTINSGKNVALAASNLVSNTVPKLRTISELQPLFSQRAINLYQLYTTTNEKAFHEIDAQLNLAIRTKFDALVHHKIPPRFETILRKQFIVYEKHQANFLLEMKGKRDWDNMRVILEQAHSSITAIFESFELLSDEIRREVAYDGSSTLTEIENLTYIQILFSMGILLVTAFVINSFYQRFRDSEQLRRLSVFPERNPSPVLRLSPDGEVDYLNPATKTLMESLNIDNPLNLLPPDWKERFPRKLSHVPVYQYESQFNNKIFLSNTSYQADLQRYHVYLEDISSRKTAEKELARRAFFDELTGLPNRRQLEENLNKEIAKSQEYVLHATLIQVNLDRFKLVNGTHGHLVGDRLIQGVSVWLKKLLEHDNISIYRYSSASWLLVKFGESTYEEINIICKKILNLSNEPINLGDRWMSVSCSMGVVYAPRDGTLIENLLGCTDSAVSSARQAGGNCYYEYSEKLKLAAENWLDTENGLREALAHEQFELYFQPKVYPSSALIAGAEVLIRWKRDGKMISPAIFIPVAEQSGLIEQIGDWVLRTSCLKWRSWTQQGYKKLPLAVNISAQQFQRVDFPELVSKIIEETNMLPEFLELEITEAVAADQPEKVVNTMLALRKIGVSLAIDDFGTGYSSLSYLQRFPINTLKIDQAFVRKIEGEDANSAITRLILSMSRELGFKVVAEGVETDVQHHFLASWGCDLLQGFLFSKPVPEEEYLQMIMMIK